MQIDEKAWNKYISMLRTLTDRTSAEILRLIDSIDFWSLSKDEIGPIMDNIFAIAKKNSDASATLSLEFFEMMSDGKISATEMAAFDDIGEIYKAYNSIKQHQNSEVFADAVSRLVKRSSADTVLKNAIKAGCEVAWIPHGETCAFCLTLASNGWVKASSSLLINGHADHIHANCDCTYAVRFDNDTTVKGYDPDKYLRIYESAPGQSPAERINAMRREFYKENSEKINKQKRIAYVKRKERESSKSEEYNVNQ